MSSSTQPRIAIVGGGPAGLTLGLLLHNQNIPFTLYELRQKPTEEELSKPSGMLDLHEESGLAALKECGLYEDFLRYTGECSESQRVADENGTILYQDEGEMSERPEISRHNLTKVLMSRVPSDQIRWSHRLVAATTTTAASGGRHTELDFGSDGKHTFDLVIGADGAWSKVRKLLTDTKPQYSGIQCITLTITDITKKHPQLAQLVGSGSFSALGHHHGVMSQRGPQDSARIYIFLSTEDENFAVTNNFKNQPASVVKETILIDAAFLGNWGPVMKDLVSTASEEEELDNPKGELDVRALYVLPPGHSWLHKNGIIIIGDASHLMGPWAGEGVNLAMWDSLLLGQAIIAAHKQADSESVSFQQALEPLLKDFEMDMAKRAQEKAEESAANGKMMFGEDAANDFVAFFRSFNPE